MIEVVIWTIVFAAISAAAAGLLRWARFDAKSYRPFGAAILFVSSLAFFGIWCVNFGAGRMASALAVYIPPSALSAANRALVRNQVPRPFHFLFGYVVILSVGLLVTSETRTRDEDDA